VQGDSLFGSDTDFRLHYKQGGAKDKTIAYANPEVNPRTAAYTITDQDDVILGNASGGAFNVTLPSAIGRQGRIFTVKKTDSSGNAVTISTTGGQTIDGAASVSLGAQFSSRMLMSDGANWLVLASI
jgi:hypothetical protein